MRRIFVLLAFVLAAIFGSSSIAAAQTEVDTYGGTPPIDVAPDDVVNVPPGDDVVDAVDTDDNEVAGDVVTRTLPVTGGDLLALTAFGASALLVGGGMLLARRRTA